MKRSEKFKSSFALSLAAAGVFYALRKRPKRIRPGQVAVITGGSSGLGLALAHELGRAGLRLALAARDIEQLHLAKRELLLSGSVNDEEDLVLIQCDVSDKHQAARLIESCLTTFDGIDLLFNDAGVIDVGPIEDQTIETFEKAMSINFFGAVHTVLSVLPYFLEKKQAAIVNISSIGGKIPVPHLLPYVASKFALTGFSEGLHCELRQKGIRVTTVCPGLMRTGGESHAHFSGRISREKSWFQTSARTPVLSADVHRAARKIISAVDAGRAEITITPQAWLAARFVGVAPESTQIIGSLINHYALPKPLALQSSARV
jgi:short-subunit dehydrogenase